MRYHRHPVGFALAVVLLVLVVLAWFVKIAAFLAVVLLLCATPEIVTAIKKRSRK